MTVVSMAEIRPKQSHFYVFQYHGTEQEITDLRNLLGTNGVQVEYIDAGTWRFLNPYMVWGIMTTAELVVFEKDGQGVSRVKAICDNETQFRTTWEEV